MRHRILRVFGQGPAFQVCFASAATRADTHTSRRCGVSPEIPRTPIHTIRSAVRRSEHPSYHPLSDSRPILYRQHTPHQQPLPDKHCCYDPMTPSRFHALLVEVCPLWFYRVIPYRLTEAAQPPELCVWRTR